MTGFDGDQLTLSHSFRFGERIALEANRWQAITGAPIRITGSPPLDSGLDTVERPDAILCRTNGGAMAEIPTLLDMGRRVALVGRGDPLAELALATGTSKRPPHKPPRAAAVLDLGRGPGLRRQRPGRP